MKVYLLYAKLSYDDYQSIFHLLPDNGRSGVFRHIENNDENYEYIGLYAWTDSKKKLERFAETRNSFREKFKVKKVNMDEDEFKEFRSANIISELNYYNYIIRNNFDRDSDDEKDESSENIMSILTTKNEFVTCTGENGRCAINEILTERTIIDYKIFTDNAQRILDKIMYVYNHIVCYAEDDEDFMYADNMAGYGLTFFGYPYDNPFDYPSEVINLFYLFRVVM